MPLYDLQTFKSEHFLEKSKRGNHMCNNEKSALNTSSAEDSCLWISSIPSFPSSKREWEVSLEEFPPLIPLYHFRVRRPQSASVLGRVLREISLARLSNYLCFWSIIREHDSESYRIPKGPDQSVADNWYLRKSEAKAFFAVLEGYNGIGDMQKIGLSHDFFAKLKAAWVWRVCESRIQSWKGWLIFTLPFSWFKSPNSLTVGRS